MPLSLHCWSACIIIVCSCIGSVGAFAPITHHHHSIRNHLHQHAPSLSQLQGVPDILSHFFQTQPYLSAFLTCSIKASAADLVAQQKPTATSSDSAAPTAPGTAVQLDLPRNLAFFTYGGIYQGCAQQYIFANLYPAWFGHWEDALLRVAAQVGMDVFVLGPCLCLPAAYGIRSLTVGVQDQQQEEKLEVSNPGHSTEQRPPEQQPPQYAWLHSYWRDVVHHQLIFKYWALWIPVNAIAFSVVPLHWRVAFIACVSFVWVLVLSLTAAAGEASAAEKITNE